MGVRLQLVNYDRMFRQSPIEPIIINDLASATEEDKELINKLISTKYDTDLLSNEPSCECGETRSGFNLGIKCHNCGTPVREIFDQELKPIVWIRSPVGVRKLINPDVWNMLSAKFTQSQFNYIEWLCNTDYQPNVIKPAGVDLLVQHKIPRGYNNFVDNFDNIISFLFSAKLFKSKGDKDDNLITLLREQRDAVFSDYVPLPNKALLIIEDNIGETYIDPIIVGALDAIRTISSVDVEEHKYSLRQKENRTCKTISKLAAYYHSTYHEVLAAKSGWFRKHNFGTRNHFSSRAVISSNTKKHAYDELHISWGVGVTMLKIHIVSKLLKRGFTPSKANDFIQRCTSIFDPLMNEIFLELINEAKAKNGKGLCCFFVRNPSLSRASVQQMWISLVKTDPNDPTTTLSILSVVGYNADKQFKLMKSPCIEEKGVNIY